MNNKFEGIFPLFLNFNNTLYDFFGEFSPYLGKFSVGAAYGILIGTFLHFFGKYIFRSIIYGGITIWILYLSKFINIQKDNISLFFGIDKNFSFSVIFHKLLSVYGFEFISFIISFLFIHVILKKYSK